MFKTFYGVTYNMTHRDGTYYGEGERIFDNKEIAKSFAARHGSKVIAHVCRLPKTIKRMEYRMNNYTIGG